MNYLNLSLTSVKRERDVDWKSASGYEMLVPVILGEMSVDEVAEMRGGAVSAIERIFDNALQILGHTFEQVMQFDVPHQLAVVDVLNAVNAEKHRLKKEYEIKKVELTALQAFTIMRSAGLTLEKAMSLVNAAE
jgi:hypothetical protein